MIDISHLYMHHEDPCDRSFFDEDTLKLHRCYNVNCDHYHSCHECAARVGLIKSCPVCGTIAPSSNKRITRYICECKCKIVMCNLDCVSFISGFAIPGELHKMLEIRDDTI